jgi:hypothetical protein
VSIPTEATANPLVEDLPPTTSEACDGCGEGTQALFTVVLTSGGLLTLCRHHAVKFGYVPADQVTYLHNDNRAKGSDHA